MKLGQNKNKNLHRKFILILFAFAYPAVNNLDV